MEKDKEVNDLRTQLGQEMVLSHENRTKFEAAVEEVHGLPNMCTFARARLCVRAWARVRVCEPHNTCRCKSSRPSSR